MCPLSAEEGKTVENIILPLSYECIQTKIFSILIVNYCKTMTWHQEVYSLPIHVIIFSQGGLRGTKVSWFH